MWGRYSKAKKSNGYASFLLQEALVNISYFVKKYIIRLKTFDNKAAINK
jgi:hypothetical protein